MAGTFEAQVSAWVLKSQRRLLAVFQTATQYVVEDVIQRSPVDTGYLRASLTVSLDGPLPIRSDARPSPGGKYAVKPYALVIAGAQIGSTIYASFVASYAAHVEYGAMGRAGAGMVRLSVQNWQQHVNRAVAEAQSRIL